MNFKRKYRTIRTHEKWGEKEGFEKEFWRELGEKKGKKRPLERTVERTRERTKSRCIRNGGFQLSKGAYFAIRESESVQNEDGFD